MRLLAVPCRFLHLFLFSAGSIQRYGGANELFQGFRIDFSPFLKINGAGGFRFKPGVEKSARII
jgi:hypothetical protein